MQKIDYSISYLRQIILSLLTMICSISYAYDFEVDGLCYNIINGNQVEVTFKNVDGGSYSGNLVIPETVIFNNVVYNVTSIGDWAFYNCNGLIGALTLPNSITTIGKSAFFGCSGLSGDLNIPNSVTSIGGSAFKNCSGFNGSLIIPNTIKSIEGGTFNGCSGLTGELTIPNSVTSIGSSAFRDCGGFTSELVLPKSLTILGVYAFSGCKGFTGTLLLPDNLELIDNYSFYGCTGFTSLVIPNTTKTIGHYAFEGCKGLESILLGAKIGTIKQAAFRYCESLEHVYSFIETPFSINYTTFQGISSNAVLHIPAGTKDAYTQFAEWVSNFKQVVEENGKNTHVLSIKAYGNGLASYDDNTIRGNSRSFIIEEGSPATVVFVPDDGYRIKSVEVNGNSVNLDNNSYTFEVYEDTNIEVLFEETPQTIYELTIISKGNGYVSFNGESVRDGEKLYTIYEGSDVSIIINPDNGNKVESVKLNDSNVNLIGNSFIISDVNNNNKIDVTFEEIERTFVFDGINYEIVSFEDRTLKVGAGEYGPVFDVPEIVDYQNEEWMVIGVTDGVLDNCQELAAVIWNLESLFDAKLSNPNLLLYVKDEAYAPPIYKNVIVNGYSPTITLTESMSNNNFYCPLSFMVGSIEYTHNYLMRTGLYESKGWETIALPFDVQKISHSSKGEIVPFAKWTNGDNTKPFWLYELSGSGFVEAEAIKANTPYIISMPNNEAYPNEYHLTGRITFSSENVKVEKSDELKTSTFNDRTFVPNFICREASDGYYALNVSNDYEFYQGSENEGSKFIQNLRKIHPFEAYMTSTSNTRSIDVFEGMTTAIHGIETFAHEQTIKVYDLSGKLLRVGTSLEDMKQGLSAGVYIVNHQKIMIK